MHFTGNGKFLNKSEVYEIVLVGFPGLQQFSILLFTTLFCIYVFIISGNILIFYVTWREPRLQSPMYSFIGVLSCLEIFYTAVTIPKMLADLLDDEKRISFTGCLLQAYFLHSLGASEIYILMVMAYDRYLAICKPLKYPSIMTARLYFILIYVCFLGGFLSPVFETVFISRLSFCGPNHIYNVFCDFPPLISLACTDPSITLLVEFSVSLLIFLMTFPFVLLSYAWINRVILKMKSTEGHQKAFSTCGAHLIVVILFFSTLAFMYIRVSKSFSVVYDEAVGLTFAVFTPLANPIIYGLKNIEIKKAIYRYLCLGGLKDAHKLKTRMS